MSSYRCTKCPWKGEKPKYNALYSQTPVACPICGSLVEDLDFLERAAIREYDGGMSRENAEKAALADLEKLYEDLA